MPGYIQYTWVSVGFLDFLGGSRDT